MSPRVATNNSAIALGGTDWPLLVPIVIAIGIGLVCGAINGFILGKYRLQPFIVTMGMLSVARGLTLLTTGGNPVSQLTDEFRWLGNGYIWVFPYRC